MNAQPSRAALAGGTLAITNVAVIPMTSDTVLRDATVLVRDGRIVAVGPTALVGEPTPFGSRAWPSAVAGSMTASARD